MEDVYTRRAHAQCLVIAGMLLGVPDDRVDSDIETDVGLTPDEIAQVRQSVDEGDIEEGAIAALALFDTMHEGRFMAEATKYVESL